MQLSNEANQNEIFIACEATLKNEVREFRQRLKYKIISNLDIDLTNEVYMDNRFLLNSIEKSKLFVCLITKKYCQSRVCLKMTEYATIKSKRMYYLIIDTFLNETEMNGLKLLINKSFHSLHYCYSNSWWLDSNFDEIKAQIDIILNVMHFLLTKLNK